MSEKETQLKKEVLQYESLVADNLNDLEKAHMALDELLNTYLFDYEPDARKALEYGNTVGAEERDENARHSWYYINDYKKIMWLVRVARDYCHSALDSCSKAYYGGVANE